MLTQKNYMKLEFPARSVNEGFARAAVAAFAAQLDPTLAEIGDIKTAVSEAVTNAVVHAYPDKLGTVQVRVRILPDERLEIAVKDHGIGIADVAQARTPLYTTGGEISGLAPVRQCSCRAYHKKTPDHSAGRVQL